MQSVWVLVREIPYEADIVTAVFTSEAALQEYARMNDPGWGSMWNWEEFQVW